MTGHPVGVVVTTCNRPELAKRAIASVLAQTLPADEILVVEDSGDSGIRQWIEELPDGRVRYTRHEANRGLAAARNTGLELTSNELLAYLGDDDRWLPDRLREQVERYASLAEETRQRIAAIKVGCRTVDPAGNVTGTVLPVNQGTLRDSIMKYGAATPSSSFLFTRSSLQAVGGFDEDLISGIDHDIWMKLAAAGYSAEIIRKPLVEIVVDERATMMSDTNRRIASIAQYVDKWSPTYEEWFGPVAGDLYGRRYFVKVVCGLAGQNFAKGRFRDGFRALRSGLARAGLRPGLLALAMARTVKTWLYYALPGVRAAKNAIFRKNWT